MSKSGSKSARIGTLLEQLQKLCLAVSESRNQLEKDNEQLRYITNKLQQMLSTQEKCRKDLMTKFPDGMSTLLLILEMSNDSQLTLNVMRCLSELLTSGKRASVLAAKGTVDIVLKIIINASRESPPNEEVILLGHVLLTKVGPKDRKFCLKARLTGALQVTMNTIRNNTSNFRVLQCTLLVVKQYTSNAVNCNTLGKAGAVSVLFKIVTACGHKRITCLKLALEVIAALVKSKTSASKAVNYGAVPVLLQMFSDWHRTDHHNRQAGVRKAIAGVLKSITMTKSGKKAFIQSDGIKVLYSLSLETLDSRELDSVNVLCSQILRRSFPKNKLPLPCSSSPLSFTILDIDSASTNNVNIQKEPEASEDSGGESSDGESEEEVSASAKEDKEETASQGPSDDSAPSTDKKQKPRDDLYMYEKFFPELYEYQVESDDSLDEEPILPNTIMIPTASDDPLSPMSSFCNLYASNTDQMDNTCQDPYGISVRDPPIGTSPPQTSASSTSNECTSRCSSAASNEIHSVLPFIKQAMTEIHGHYSPAEPESLGPKKNTLQKTMIFRDIDRLIQPQKVVDKVVYDLDALLKQPNKEATLKVSSSNTSRKGSASSNSSTSDSEKMSSDGSSKTLKFESRFECGNLRKAIQIREHEYDLILNPDINCRHHHQWFYFEVSNMDADVPYKFNIVNCEKINSQFNFGMQPVLYSSEEALNGRPGWVRSGTNVCYYRNYFARQQNGCQRSKTYFTSTFTITFPYSDDTCYLAYHYPYSFTMLQDHLSRLEVSIPSDIFYRRSTLCHSLAGNPCDVITITAAPRRKDSFSLESFRNRPYVFLSARVHPGESNSSWVMKGVLDFLLSSLYTAKNLRERFIFKIVPMLNVDGVINGCHRCSLSGDDLNRRWSNPSMILHPTIYHTKGLLQYLQAIDKTPIVFCDFHGHSRKKNVFMYGCSKASTISASSSSSSPDMDESASVSNEQSADVLSESDSTSSMDASEIVEDMGYRTLPSALHNIAPAFFLGSCSFIVEPSKESTARVVVWREIGVLRSYTMESTYSGCDQGPYKGCHLGTRELEEMGRFFCAGLLRIARPFMHRDQVNHSQLSNHSTESSENKDNWIRTSELFVPVSSVPCEYGGSSEENT